MAETAIAAFNNYIFLFYTATPSGLTNNYLTYAPFPFPAEPWLYYSDIAMFEREFTFKK